MTLEKTIDLVKEILQLPGCIFYQGIYFEFQIFINGSELRLCYDIISVPESNENFSEFKETGCWQNPFYDNAFKGFLYLHENISNDKQLIDAIRDCKKFLKKNRLWIK